MSELNTHLNEKESIYNGLQPAIGVLGQLALPLGTGSAASNFASFENDLFDASRYFCRPVYIFRR